jgi:ACT domain-containing protein
MENKASVGLKRKIVNSLKKSGVNIKSIDLGSIEDLNDLLSRDEIDNDIKDLIKELIESIGEKDLESSLMTTSRSGVLLGKDGQETILNKFYNKMPLIIMVGIPCSGKTKRAN